MKKLLIIIIFQISISTVMAQKLDSLKRDIDWKLHTIDFKLDDAHGEILAAGIFFVIGSGIHTYQILYPPKNINQVKILSLSGIGCYLIGGFCLMEAGYELKRSKNIALKYGSTGVGIAYNFK